MTSTTVTSTTIHECSVRLKGATKAGHAGRCGPPSLPAGRVPRVARLLALAHKFDGLLRRGAVANGAALARLGHVSRARIAQIFNLLYLAPDIQEQILFLARTVHGRDRLHLRQLQLVARIPDWGQQRLLWRKMLGSVPPGPGWQNGATMALAGKDDHGQV
jgi:hypothetical protein